MKKIKLLIPVLLLGFSLSAQTDSSTVLAKELLDITGSGKLGVQMMSQMIETFKTQAPTAPDAFWDEFMKEVNVDELTNLIIPIYAKHFSNTELAELVRFYKSPLGQRFISKMPAILQDSYAVGQEWGRTLGEKVAKKLIEKGYLKDK